MAATMATMAILNAKCSSTPTKNTPSTKQPTEPISIQNLPLCLTFSKATSLSLSLPFRRAVFSSLSFSDPALAAQEISDIPEGDNGGLALFLPVVSAIAWVLYNILWPALNQLNRMRSEKGGTNGLGLGGLTPSGLLCGPFNGS